MTSPTSWNPSESRNHARSTGDPYAMSIKPPRSENYAAAVVALKDFVDLPNCDNVKAAVLFGNSIIISKDSIAGEIGIFFPAETQLTPEMLGANNLYRKPEFGNVDPEKKGFFEQHGRVKTMKFRGYKSEGFWLPLAALDWTGIDYRDIPVGTSFDYLGDHEICRKYIPRGKAVRPSSNKERLARPEDSIVDGQFRFHFDTENLRGHVYKLNPNDWISISDKWHGTSVVISKVLVKRKLNLLHRVVRKVGIPISDQVYGITYSSRRVIKAVNGVDKEGDSFYATDIYGAVAREVADLVPAGFTLYGEILGFTEDGSPIQGGYHYGCEPCKHRFIVYRITVTTAEGKVVELSWPQMLEFCSRNALEPAVTHYYGRAQGLFPKLDTAQHWHENFLKRLEEAYVHDGLCAYNNNEVPAEGIVLRVDNLHQCESYKLKNFRFLEAESKQLDKGVLDTETAQSEPEEVTHAVE